ncbi:MAG: AraC family transcriptional regulator [Lachnospiraceae bacterium]|nr:AraC family transcriptional regulator [Lachnospiraceae bacterium]
MEKSLKDQAIKYANHFAVVLEATVSVVDLAEKKYIPAGDREQFEVCEHCPHKNCQGYEQFAYGCREAYRWDGLYTFHCSQEMVLVCASIASEKGDLAGGLVIGPLFLDNKEEMLNSVSDKQLLKALNEVSEYSPHKIQAMAELIAGIAGNISDLSHGKAGRYFYRQESLLNAIYIEKMKKSEISDYYTYPIAIERKLRTAVRSRDKEGSQTLLNQILAHIYVSNNNNIDAIKPRITELIVVISRAAVDAGADINEIFLINENFTTNIEEFTNLEDLSAWVSNMLQRFISFTFEFDKVKHADAVYKVIEYIKSNYRRHMSLEDIAASTYLSKTYLSSLFKKETGYSISEYINIVRIERSKSLLMEENMSIIEIANLCGFEDQSYFTKVFKNIVGITPKKYRENRGKNEKRDIILK